MLIIRHLPMSPDAHIIQALACVVPHPALGILEASQYRRDDSPEERRDILAKSDSGGS